MSSQPENHSNVAKEGGTALSKRVAKKETLKQEKLKRQQEAAAADPLSENYGDVPVRDLQSKAVSGRKWTDIGLIDENMKGETVLIRGRIQTICPVGNQLVFLVLRRKSCTMQCVVEYAENVVSRKMVKYASSLSKESHVDVEGIVSVPNAPIKNTTQQVELQVRKIKGITIASPTLPINIEEIRTLDLRTAANQAIFRIQCEVETIFRQYLLSEGFVGIHTPKLLPGSSKGCAAVFRLKYDGRPACLAQSTQLHRQMAISADYDRVFEIGPVFRAQFGSVCEGAEDSFAHKHLCEFIDLSVEMEIYEHYSEVMDVVDCLFVAMFDSLNENCKKELEAIGKQYPSEPLKYLRKTLRLTFEDGVQMLKEAGVVVKPLGDLNTEEQRMLGKLVLEKYGTEFYILHRYPLAVNYYTMPCYDDPEYSNSFDVFIRGEGIASAGGQRVHVPELLSTKAKGLGIDEKSFQTYIDAFRYGTPPHGGFGVGLERAVMLFCGLNDIRKTSLFPRGPKMLIP